ncbi:MULTISPECIES: hypothetical protein [Halorussus]|uniref:hypothetical protein n=1 Tax=Halorussus TaxID=1070314 RepID=UPI00209D59B2|nr:hypothetical protein [Halorussus vallis]USZ75650.1 hypothetical protein NGM07_19755 [Halorussus vallis]USZ75704.1 hypothetical protein NGM07_20030 [Halorussus vallis]
MTYIYECDGFCDEGPQDRPALTAEFSEQWFKTTTYGDHLKEHGYEPGDLVTLCGECTRQLLLDF